MNMYDPINRNDAIEAAKDLLKYHGQNLTEELINYFSTNAMNRIPSSVIYCGECKHMMPDGICREFADETIRPSASDYCSAAERRTDE